MKIQIYTLEHCSYCILTKELLIKKKLTYNEKNLKNNIKIFDYIIKKYNYKTAPLIFINKKFIGGYNELKIILNKKQL